MNVPFDSFAVPAAHRIVKAVLFTRARGGHDARHAERRGYPRCCSPSTTRTTARCRNAIAAVRTGASAGVGGLLLHAVVFSYPAVDVVAVPSLAAAIVGAVLVFGGLIAKGADRNAAGR